MLVNTHPRDTTLSQRDRLSLAVSAVAVAIVLMSCGGSTRSNPIDLPTSPHQAPVAAPRPGAASRPLRARSSSRARPLAGRIVVIDPGHNGGNADAATIINRLVPAGRGRTKPCNTTGTATDSGYEEAALNWDVALRLRRLLAARGARVVLTRQDNSGVGPCVDRRAAIANAARADAVIAIHADGGPASGRGFHVIYPPPTGSTASIYEASLRLAQAIHQSILAAGVLPTSTYAGRDGYDQRDDLAGLNLATRPAVFVELGNMRNNIDAALQTKPSVRGVLARALANGLTRFLRGGR